MGASNHRFSAAGGLVAGLALFVASGCGGAASTALDQPPSGKGDNGGADTSIGSHEGSGSSSGGTADATLDESNPGDMTADAADDSAGDDGATPDDGGPPEASLCPTPCGLGMRCCSVPTRVSYGQCYSVVCPFCCPP